MAINKYFLGVFRVNKIRISTNPGKKSTYEKVKSEAILTKKPKLKIVESRCVLNSISLSIAFRASNMNPNAAISAVKEKRSNEIRVNKENSRVGTNVFSGKARLSIRMKPRKALCKNKIRKARMCRPNTNRPKKMSAIP